MYVLHDIDHPERYGGLPKDPQVPLAGALLESRRSSGWAMLRWSAGFWASPCITFGIGPKKVAGEPADIGEKP